MKKSKLVTCLSAAFISAMALMSCSSLIKPHGDVILTINGIPYTAEELFEDQKTPAAAEAKFNAVYKVAIRNYFVNGDGIVDKEEIERNTKIKINEEKANAQSNAVKNGTTYAYEWQKILDSNGVENESELYSKFEYDLQKEKFENKFYDKHYKELKSGNKFPGLPNEEKYKFTSYIEGKQPYHIKHILVKLGEGAKAGDSTSATITPDIARNISGVIKALANGDSFEEVSTSFNEDDTAKENGGSLGIMSRDTSFVNDFKLGIYEYEAFHGSSTTLHTPQTKFEEKDAKTELFGSEPYKKGTAGYYATEISKLEDPTTTNATTVPTEIGIGQIPYGAVEDLFNYADYDLENNVTIKERFLKAGLTKDDVAAKYLPRNVIFNKYFNKHNIMVVTPKQTNDYYGTGTTHGKISEWIDVENKKPRLSNKPELFRGSDIDPTYSGLDGFNRETSRKNDDEVRDTFYHDGPTTPGPDTSKSFLRDENGRIVLVFRSGTGGSSSNEDYQGIHFVVIERSPFIGKEFDSPNQETKDTSREDYYWHTYPGQKGISAEDKHPTYTNTPEATDWKKTFVNFTPELAAEAKLKERAETVKSELKKCDSKLNTYLYQNLIVTGQIEFTQKAKDLGIDTSIDSWITMSRESNKFDTERTWNETWEEYYYSLASQIEQRHLEGANCKLVPEYCVTSFIEDNFNKASDGSDISLYDLFGKGGAFHE